jgi:hypothetical protein
MSIFWKRAVALCLFASSGSAYALTGYRNAYIEEVQSGTVAFDGGRMYLRQTGAWLGSPSCDPDWAYFNAASNPHLVGIALAAHAAQKNVRVYVDDTLQKTSGGHCQVTVIIILEG